MGKCSQVHLTDVIKYMKTCKHKCKKTYKQNTIKLDYDYVNEGKASLNSYVFRCD